MFTVSVVVHTCIISCDMHSLIIKDMMCVCVYLIIVHPLKIVIIIVGPEGRDHEAVGFNVLHIETVH